MILNLTMIICGVFKPTELKHDIIKLLFKRLSDGFRL
jgi:hypothetical protein